jgi:hypothetical protein
MNSFVKGMGRFNLFPPPKSHRTEPGNAWNKVAIAFAKTGTNMRTAINTLNVQVYPPSSNVTYGK